MTLTARPRLAILFVALAALFLSLTGAPVQAQDDSVPAKPTGVVTTATHDSVALAWDDPGDTSITHYQIFRRDRDLHDAGEFVTIKENTGSAATSYTDDTVEPERHYVYRVKAVNQHGASTWSKFVRANTPVAPAAAPAAEPTQAQQTTCQLGQVNNFKVESSGGVFTATWDYPDDCDATAFPGDFNIVVEWKRLFSINVGIDGDGVTWDDGSWDEFREATCEQGTVTTTCTFGRNNIKTGEQFVVRVKTQGQDDTVTTRAVGVFPVVASNFPGAVTGTMASPEANDSCTVTSGRKATPIELSWEAVSGVSSYQIWRAGSENTFSNSFASDRILVSSTSGTTYTDSSATHGRQTYQYVVFPRLGGALLDGKWSVALVQTPGADRPGNISAVDGDTEDTKFTVSWSTPSDDGGCDITGYAIYLYEYKYLADGSVEVDSDGELPFVSEGTAGASATSWESPSMARTYRADGRDYGRQFHVELRAVTAYGEGVPNFILFTGWN